MASAKSGTRTIADEYAGTGPDDTGTSGPDSGLDNATGIDPADIDGSRDGGTDGSRGDEFDPAIHVSPTKRNADGSYTRKRGRKAGSAGPRAYSQKAQTNLGTSIDALSKTLLIVHSGLAVVSRTPELMLEKDESDMLAKALANVLEQFDIAPDPKTQALIGLVTTAGVIYAPRVINIQYRKAQEKKEKQSGTAGVYDASGAPIGTTEFSVSN